MKKKFTFLGGVIAVMLLSLPTWAYVQTQQRAGETVEPVEAPYEADLTSKEVFDKFIVVDADEDNTTWKWTSVFYTDETYTSFSYGYQEGDDYLVLPIQLEANKSYEVKVSAAVYNSDYSGKFEVKVGKATNTSDVDESQIVTDLTATIINPTEVNNTSYVDYKGEFTSDSEGIWYVAIHAISDVDYSTLKVKSLSIEKMAEQTAPAAVKDFTVVAGEQGALEAKLTFTAPSTTIGGDNLTDDMTIKIYRDGKEVENDLGSVGPNTQQQWIDNNGLEDGHTYTYYVVAVNGSGDGAKSESVSVYVGNDVLTDVENVKAVTGENGITLTWDPVKGQNGGYVNESLVKYAVVELTENPWFGYIEEGNPLATVDACTYTIELAVDEGEQIVKNYGVKATINEGNDYTSPKSSVAKVMVGAPYDLPVEETFEKKESLLWILSSNASSYVEEDDNYLVIYASTGTVTYESGKLNLQSTTNPILMFDA